MNQIDQLENRLANHVRPGPACPGRESDFLARTSTVLCTGDCENRRNHLQWVSVTLSSRPKLPPFRSRQRSICPRHRFLDRGRDSRLFVLASKSDSLPGQAGQGLTRDKPCAQLQRSRFLLPPGTCEFQNLRAATRNKTLVVRNDTEEVEMEDGKKGKFKN